MAGALALTTIAGGINRLRTKGGADKNSLYELTNGYVTQAGTVKVRPGTFRNANIGQYSGAGLTKGLVAYQSIFHVFSHEVVGVPDDYELHVLNHPAAQQVVTTGSNINVTTNVTAADSGAASFPYSGTWESAGVGYSNSALSSNLLAAGAASITAIGTASLAVAGVTTGNGFGTSPHSPIITIALSGSQPQDLFTSVTITPAGGSPQVLTTASAQYNLAIPGQGSPSGITTWTWAVSVAANYFANGVVSAVTFTAVATETITTVPIPIKEIHFQAPYLGGLYVVAEFDVTSDVRDQFGDTFHYWIQSSEGGDNANFWQKNTDYQIGDVVIPTTPNGLTYIASRLGNPNPVWTANTLEAVNNIVEPTIPNGFMFTATAVAGASPSTGATEPVWPLSDGAIVTENSALDTDQTFSIAQPAAPTPAPTVPSRYVGGVGFGK